jgi:endonuclease/exonuclease/phosphatase family metal-dependent hydrolase
LSQLIVATLNLLNDLSLWDKRRTLIVQEFRHLKPDILALQEVSLIIHNAEWLAERLEMPFVFVTAKTGHAQEKEGIALLSRFPIHEKISLDLGSQERVAQCILIENASRRVWIANTHLYWQPGDSAARSQQASRLLEWVSEIKKEDPAIVCGDFNGTPETKAIELISQQYQSAFKVANGNEPEFTCPTPLQRSRRSLYRTVIKYFFNLRPTKNALKWRGTLDYIFVDKGITVMESQLCLTQPDANNPRLYPSDHFGLHSRLEV